MFQAPNGILISYIAETFSYNAWNRKPGLCKAAYASAL